ncbi:MAG TPA: transcriptional regulator GcvA [Dongiaceae bacterium]|nr:transcriptional regulator GcvA [Dongiaceae bacterium]
MAERLPPLNALRCFDVAAKHLSFTKAAAELNVTHSAVSHQIKALEAWLGAPLFRRVNRGLVLTSAGQAYLKPVRDSFERLGEATRRLRVRERSGPLTVSIMPSFAAKWLVPRLRRFRERHPDIDVRISANSQLTDFSREDVDICIRYGRGVWPDVDIELLMRETMFPVASPRLLEGPVPLKVPADLAHHTLISDYDWRVDFWQLWLEAAGMSDFVVRHSLSFNYSNLMLQAAIDGLGVALSQNALAGDDLAAGRLVRLFDYALPTDYGYYVVVPEGTAQRPKIAAFRNWLLEETCGPAAGVPLETPAG